MFGMIRPCRNRLGDELRAVWTAHLCGMCLALRDEHGHAARLVTNYDAIVVSALVEAQTGTSGHRRDAKACALRGMRPASVAHGGSARLAASVSLLLASASLRDHVDDGDVTGRLRVRATRRIADRWADAGAETGGSVALDSRTILDAVARQRTAELAPTSLLDVTAPTEAATSLAFAHTAVLAGRLDNRAPLAEIGRLFGRVAHLLDAVEDLPTDRTSGAWNPILALDLSPAEVRAHCTDAALGIRLALADVDLVEPRLVHVLLAHEVDTAIRRTFATAGQPQPPLTPPQPPDQQPPERPHWEAPPPQQQKGVLAGCLAALVACGTCQACRNDGDEEREGWGRRLGDCGDACDGCDDCCDCCDCDCCECCTCCDGCDC